MRCAAVPYGIASVLMYFAVVHASSGVPAPVLGVALCVCVLSFVSCVGGARRFCVLSMFCISMGS